MNYTELTTPENCILAARLFKDHAEVAIQGNPSKNVTLSDLMSLLNTGITGAANVEDFNFMDVPEGLIRISRSAVEMKILMYMPEKLVSVTHTGSKEPLRMWFPNIVMTFILTKNGGSWIIKNSVWSATELSREAVTSLKTKFPTYKEEKQLHHLPLPNVYDNGGLCLGRNELPTTFTESTLKGLKYYWDFLHLTPFNNDLRVPCRNAPTNALEYLNWHNARVESGATGFPNEIFAK